MSHYLQNGILELTDLTIPSTERRKKGRVIIIECVQHIPCDPCANICPKGAITIEGEITNIPQVDFDKCNGCGLCLANCPGLAIFSVDESLPNNEAEVGIPYEFRPLPEVGEVVDVINRSGQIIGNGKVLKVRNPKSYDRTPVIYLSVPQELSLEVRFLKRKET